MKYRALAGSAVAVALIAGTAIVHALHPREEVVVTTSTVDLGSIVQQVVATGTLQAVTSVDVGTQVSGTVQSLGADFNSLVHAGQVLARLDPSTYEAQLSAASATLAEDAAQVDNATVAFNDAQAQLARAKELYTEHLITQADFDIAQVAMDSAAASLKSAEAQEAQGRATVRGAELDLAHTVIRAPQDGIVVARDVDTGQTVTATIQTPTMFTIASDLEKMQLQASIDESDVGDLRVGDAATFTVDAYPRETFNGVVSVVRLQPMLQSSGMSGGTGGGSPTGGSSAADRSGGSGAQSSALSPEQAVPPGSVVSYTTIINVANPNERLRPGMTAISAIETARRDDVLRVPESALTFRPSNDVLQKAGERLTQTVGSQASGGAPGKPGTVWLYEGERFTPVNVRTGFSDDQWAEVLSGPLRPGQQVVTSATRQKKK